MLELPNSLEKFRRLSALARDFVYVAEVYGRIIISETYISVENKTIKPQTIGGIAGGSKYICQGILFKYALDVPLLSELS